MIYTITDTQKKQLVKLRITNDKLTQLHTIIIKNKLPDDVWNVVIWSAIRLADFEQNEKKLIKTEKEQIESIKAIERASIALRDAIEALSMGDLMSIDNQLFMIDSQEATNCEKLISRAILIQRTACATAYAAKNELSRLELNGANGLGRKQVLKSYAGHIAVLAHQLMPYEIKPGEGGIFHEICDSIFSAAGVHASSLGSIKYFKKHMRPDYKKRGMCL